MCIADLDDSSSSAAALRSDKLSWRSTAALRQVECKVTSKTDDLLHNVGQIRMLVFSRVEDDVGLSRLRLLQLLGLRRRHFSSKNDADGRGVRDDIVPFWEHLLIKQDSAFPLGPSEDAISSGNGVCKTCVSSRNIQQSCPYAACKDCLSWPAR